MEVLYRLNIWCYQFGMSAAKKKQTYWRKVLRLFAFLMLSIYFTIWVNPNLITTLFKAFQCIFRPVSIFIFVSRTPLRGCSVWRQLKMEWNRDMTCRCVKIWNGNTTEWWTQKYYRNTQKYDGNVQLNGIVCIGPRGDCQRRSGKSRSAGAWR